MACGSSRRCKFAESKSFPGITRRAKPVRGQPSILQRLSSRSPFQGFDFTASPKLPAAQVRDLAAPR
jgi:hypothetical protein